MSESRPCATQIMNLLCLAPDIQEAIIFLPGITEGRAPVAERTLRDAAAPPDWNERRRSWKVSYTPMLERIAAPAPSKQGFRFCPLEKALALKTARGLYWDRPKEEWPRTADGSLAMFTAPLNLDRLLQL